MEGQKLFELAKYLGMTNKKLLSELKTMGIDAKSYMSVLDDETVSLIKGKFGNGEKAEAEAKFQEKASKKSNEMDSIRLSFSSKREDYEKLRLELYRLFDYVIDPRFPKEAIYTTKYRIKNMERLIEKIETHNQKNLSDQIDNSNYKSKIDDLLGIRLICYRRSDKGTVNNFIKDLQKENKLFFVRDPEEKKPQYIWIELAGENSDEKNSREDIQYSGYSSTHYFVKLPDSAPPNIKDLHAEIQVRTIFEDAWAELDHKYRYEYKRKGIEIPKSIDRGFRSLSAYVQAALVHAEFLCKDIDEEIKTCKSEEPALISSEKLTMEQVFKSKMGFIPTERTLLYFKKRICIDGGYELNTMPELLQHEVFSKFTIEEFKNIYSNIIEKEPFKNSEDRDVDLINLLNYFLEKSLYGKKVAQNGLRDVLRERFRNWNAITAITAITARGTVLIKKKHT